jgi:enterochelin esterase family protein
VLTDRSYRALAGLSMGGAETLRVAPSRPDRFAYLGIFNMGLQTRRDQGVAADFEARNATFLATARATTELLKRFWIGVGSNDRTATAGPRKLDELLTRQGIDHPFHESEGGHTRIHRRHYRADIAPLLFS